MCHNFHLETKPQSSTGISVCQTYYFIKSDSDDLELLHSSAATACLPRVDSRYFDIINLLLSTFYAGALGGVVVKALHY
jgi:hypothetical protein